MHTDFPIIGSIAVARRDAAGGSYMHGGEVEGDPDSCGVIVSFQHAHAHANVHAQYTMYIIQILQVHAPCWNLQKDSWRESKGLADCLRAHGILRKGLCAQLSTRVRLFVRACMKVCL